MADHPLGTFERSCDVVCVRVCVPKFSNVDLSEQHRPNSLVKNYLHLEIQGLIEN